jgi:hypothetical protein
MNIFERFIFWLKYRVFGFSPFRSEKYRQKHPEQFGGTNCITDYEYINRIGQINGKACIVPRGIDPESFFNDHFRMTMGTAK